MTFLSVSPYHRLNRGVSKGKDQNTVGRGGRTVLYLYFDFIYKVKITMRALCAVFVILKFYFIKSPKDRILYSTI